MDYFLAFLLLAGIIFFTTIISGIFKSLIPILYLVLGYILGSEYIILGIGGMIGCIINIYNTKKYIGNQGTLSVAPANGIKASYLFLISFSITIILKEFLNLDFLENLNYWYLLIAAFLFWGITSIVKNKLTNSNNYLDEVTKFEIVEKYDTDPKWATYLYFKNGDESWNETIYGSFRAKDPENDLTFVFETKEKALNYAQDTFKNAEYYDSQESELSELKETINKANIQLESEYFNLFETYILKKASENPSWLKTKINNIDFESEIFIYNELISFVLLEIKTGNYHIKKGELSEKGIELGHLYYNSINYLFEKNKISELKADNHKMEFMKLYRTNYESKRN